MADIEGGQATSELTPPKQNVDRYRNLFVNIQIILFILVVILVIIGLLSPATLLFIINVIWILTFVIAIVFLLIGAMVIFGLKDEAKAILAVFLEGSLTIIDFIDFIKLVIKEVIHTIQETIFFLTPVFAYILAFIIYLSLLILYKWVGRTYDVTVMTIILTAILILFVGFLNRPRPPETGELPWGKRVRKRFMEVFSDAIEVVVFVFFITMDNTNLFFLPKSLNVPIRAQILGVDLMRHGWEITEAFQFTFSMIIAIVLIEIIRFGLRIAWGGFYFYKEMHQYMGNENPMFTTSTQIKQAIRQSFDSNKDDIVKIMTYFTILILVFLAFPKLKLLSMAVTSVTTLLLDLLMRERLGIKRGNDLVGRIISKIFGV